jgi:hypothetical protein
VGKLFGQTGIDRINEKHQQAGAGNHKSDPDLDQQIERFLTFQMNVLYVMGHEGRYYGIQPDAE